MPNGGKLEMRVRGPNVFPGYRTQPELTRQGLRRRGLLPHRRRRPPRRRRATRARRGLRRPRRRGLQARPAAPGCRWARCALRAVSALAPLAADVVVTGHDRDEVGLLVFPIAAGGASMPPNELAARLRAALQALRAGGGGSSQGRRARCCSPSRRAPTPARSPTRATSTSAACWRGAPPKWRRSMRATTRGWWWVEGCCPWLAALASPGRSRRLEAARRRLSRPSTAPPSTPWRRGSTPPRRAGSRCCRSRPPACSAPAARPSAATGRHR